MYPEVAVASAGGPDAPELSRRIALFEDRYGNGSYGQLQEMLQQPCVSFAQIATRFGVTRERVRQWHLELFPEAPRGRERRRLCREHQDKRRLLTDPLFRAFYRHARTHLGVGRVALIAGAGGFRSRTVKLRGRLVALRDASRRDSEGLRYRGHADYVYFLLSDGGFLFVSTARESVAGVHNSFAAFEEAVAS